ncbi:hypothetical protein LNA76_04395 [Alcaligenes sp. MMA]|uniref:hypothetical protein n=1 Tax=Alcaligenes sp. MMA TaxID=2893019 RepID=UPI001E2B9AE1|nr:hypothetical protein [Alcaligenes sp. MMA]MCC9162560.1 hypothetical protein [Alcaligenes sp. MMA]
MKSNSAIETFLLPQYNTSAAFMERFLVAAHAEGTAIERSPNNQGIKLVDGNEINADFFDYFIEEKDCFREEFANELKGKISDKEFDDFCQTVAEDWFDGKRLRQNGRARCLKRSVYDYLSTLAGNSMDRDQFVQSQDLPLDVEPLITVKSIAAILTVNDQMIYRHFEGWKSYHSDSDNLSDDNIFLRRGLALESELDTAIPYREYDFLNSYSIAFSASEKFAQMRGALTPAMINGEISLFHNRVLFFSPFIPDMDVGQLEFGIIPHEKPHCLVSQGVHGGIHEYIMDPTPFQQ